MRRLDTIDLRLLRVFIALVDARGFAGAQITLNLSLSTLSMHTRRIWRQFERHVEQLRKTRPSAASASSSTRLRPANRSSYAAEQRLKLPTEPPEAYHPAADGLVFTVAEIETFVDRKNRHSQADDYWYGRNKAA